MLEGLYRILVRVIKKYINYYLDLFRICGGKKEGIA